jgi:acetyl esterase/lipase
LAAVVAQIARDTGGPTLSAQLLLTPVTDGVVEHPSHTENGEGYVLTAALMRWFWDHYADQSQRSDPRASPLRAERLDGLPPAVVITCEFDPLRDEGNAYADALIAAGVPVEHLRIAGHTHTSLTAVDVLVTGAAVRAEIAAKLTGFLANTVNA